MPVTTFSSFSGVSTCPSPPFLLWSSFPPTTWISNSPLASTLAVPVTFTWSPKLSFSTLSSALYLFPYPHAPQYRTCISTGFVMFLSFRRRALFTLRLRSSGCVSSFVPLDLSLVQGLWWRRKGAIDRSIPFPRNHGDSHRYLMRVISTRLLWDSLPDGPKETNEGEKKRCWCHSSQDRSYGSLPSPRHITKRSKKAVQASFTSMRMGKDTNTRRTKTNTCVRNVGTRRGPEWMDGFYGLRTSKHVLALSPCTFGSTSAPATSCEPGRPRRTMPNRSCLLP